jgi:hypothetical protein
MFPEDAELQIHDDSGEVSVANVLGDMNVETLELAWILKTQLDISPCGQ